MSGEFELIDLIRERVAGQPGDPSVLLGIGDDSALLRPAPGHDLASCIDTLLAGVHFRPDDPPDTVGHKALAVNLSDLAAMGATPRWALLSLTLPAGDAVWLSRFLDGFLALACEHDLVLVGGDVTAGSLGISVQLCGELPAGKGLRRGGAKAGDVVIVTGTLGDAALALALLDEGAEAPPALLERLRRPAPRVRAGRAVIDLAHAAIDVSDGLVADLGHVCRASGLGARIDLDRIPRSAEFRRFAPASRAAELVLTVGDDYELCLACPPRSEGAVQDALAAAGTCGTTIGALEDGSGVVVEDRGRRLDLRCEGYSHLG